MVVSSSRARSRRRLRPRPATGPGALVLLVAVLAAAPLLSQAFRLPWGAHRQSQQSQRPPQPSLAPVGAQQQRGSPVVMFAKPKKGPKGLDAAKAAGTCVRACVRASTLIIML